MMKKIIFAYALLTFSSIAPCVAEEYSPDTLQAAAVQLMPAAHVAPDPHAISKDTLRLNPKLEWMDRAFKSRLFRATYMGVPLIAGGLIVKHQDTKFRKLRNDFLPHFRRPVDDYMQYLPAAVMVGLKAAGIPSRSSWGRMLLSDMFTVTAMGLTVDGLKRTTQVTRPDGTNRHSFPSGHTATAFMTATMLTKEYGHLSPWVGVGAYSLATATGLMRVANNKHWISDVMVGAGIGILSTELGYWLADLIMKDKGLNVKDSPEMYAALFRPTPSFLSLTEGFSLPLSHYDIREGEAFETTTGTAIGLEGACFFSPYLGIGGKASAANLHYIVNGQEAPDNTFKFYTLQAGPYFSLPLSKRWRVGSKLVGGAVFYSPTDINGTPIPRHCGPAFWSGLSTDLQVRSNLSIGTYLDYNVQVPGSKYSHEYIHVLTLGGRASIRF